MRKINENDTIPPKRKYNGKSQRSWRTKSRATSRGLGSRKSNRSRRSYRKRRAEHDAVEDRISGQNEVNQLVEALNRVTILLKNNVERK